MALAWAIQRIQKIIPGVWKGFAKQSCSKPWRALIPGDCFLRSNSKSPCQKLPRIHHYLSEVSITAISTQLPNTSLANSAHMRTTLFSLPATIGTPFRLSPDRMNSTFFACILATLSINYTTNSRKKIRRNELYIARHTFVSNISRDCVRVAIAIKFLNIKIS